MGGPSNDRSRSPFGHTSAIRPPSMASNYNVGVTVPGTRGGMTSNLSALSSAGGGNGPAAFIGQTLEGWVRSFKGTWGFINSESFEGDLFMGTKSNQGLPASLAADERVAFRVSQGPSGKLEATD